MTDTDDKILEILKLSGVPPRDYDIARPNLEELEDEQLDRELALLRAREEKFALWRKSRGVPGQKQETVSSASIVGAESREGSFEFLARELEGSNVSLKKELEDVAQAILMLSQRRTGVLVPQRFEILSRLIFDTREWVAEKIRGASYSSRDATLDVFVRERIMSAVRSSNTAASYLAEDLIREIAALLKHPPLQADVPMITRTGMIEAMARVANVITHYKPDLIVAGKEEGHSVARALAFDLRMSELPILIFSGHHDTALSWTPPEQPVATPRTIAVIGSLGFSGRTMYRVTQEMRERYGTERVYNVVLVATQNAVAEIAPVGRLVYHQLTAASPPKLREFNPVVGIKIGPVGYMVQSKDENSSITFDELKISRRELERIFPPEPPPWRPVG